MFNDLWEKIVQAQQKSIELENIISSIYKLVDPTVFDEIVDFGKAENVGEAICDYIVTGENETALKNSLKALDEKLNQQIGVPKEEPETEEMSSKVKDRVVNKAAVKADDSPESASYVDSEQSNYFKEQSESMFKEYEESEEEAEVSDSPIKEPAKTEDADTFYVPEVEETPVKREVHQRKLSTNKKSVDGESVHKEAVKEESAPQGQPEKKPIKKEPPKNIKKQNTGSSKDNSVEKQPYKKPLKRGNY